MLKFVYISSLSGGRAQQKEYPFSAIPLSCDLTKGSPITQSNHFLTAFNLQLWNNDAKNQTAAFSFQAFSGKAQAVQYDLILCTLCHKSSISKSFTDVNSLSKQTGCDLRGTVEHPGLFNED